MRERNRIDSIHDEPVYSKAFAKHTDPLIVGESHNNEPEESSESRVQSGDDLTGLY